MKLRFAGAAVFIPPTAEIMIRFMGMGSVIQEMLYDTDAWEEGQDPIETIRLGRDMDAIVAPVEDRSSVFWAVHANHTARHPEPSPFIKDVRLKTDLLTIELAGSPDKPILARVYPGDYTPPLPWQKSARNADGGIEACTDFWSTHAYIYNGKEARQPMSTQAPDWFKQLV